MKNTKQNNLAIVIPAYKDTYLDKALDSIAKQTNHAFTVYIGDDASPYDLSSIVDEYQGLIDIVYERFDTNLGGSDLVAQWERCIALTQGELWIWLFSDDDVLDKNCVECFYRHIKTNVQDKLLHFNVNVIDGKGCIVSSTTFPAKLDAFSFALFKLKGRLKSYVVEYIFRRDLYESIGGFQKYDLAWNADDATWIEMAKRDCITTISGACVNWRKSDLNISPNVKDVSVVKRKINADLCYIKKLSNSFFGFLLKFRLYMAILTWFSVNLVKYEKVLRKKDVVAYLKECVLATGCPLLFPFAVGYFIVKRRKIGEF